MQRLLFELVVTSGLAAVFIVQLEGFGYALEHGWRRWCRARGWTRGARAELPGMFFLRILLGGLLYTAVFFWIGVAGLLHPAVVLAVSAAVPVAAFVLGKRWRGFRPALKAVRADWPIALGIAVFFAVTLTFWFRPITGFDALWYHLPIPKFFLQEGGIPEIGGVRYSLHPVMTYFWYLWPLSLDLTMPVKGMIVNFIQMLFMGASLSYLLVVCRRYLRWNRWLPIVAPVLLAVTVEGLVWSFGTGFNDGVAMAVGFVMAGIYVTATRTKAFTWELFGFGIMAIVALATLKLYFSMCAVPVFVWFVWRAYRDLPEPGKVRRMATTVLGLGAVFYLPWLVRSYLESGRILDPVGKPGLNEDSYRNAGSLTAHNHWTSFIFTRFRDYLPTIAVSAYNPLFLAGMASIAHPRIRQDYLGLWVAGFAGFWFVYFASIVTNWRYMFPAAAILIFLGLASVIESRKPTRFNLAWLTAAAALTLASIFYNVREVLPWTGWLTLGLGAAALAAAGYGWAKRNTRVLTAAVVVGVLVFAGSVIRIVATHSGANYLESGQDRKEYIDARSVQPYDAYPAATLTPPGYTTTEPIFAVGVHNLAYIENPILEARATPRYFEGVTTIPELTERLKRNGVRFVLVMDPGLFPDACQVIGVTDYRACTIDDSRDWRIATRDARRGPIWLELR